MHICLLSMPTSSMGLRSHVVKPLKSKNGRKACEEFCLTDIDQLLHAVININPYMVPRNKISSKWKEVESNIKVAGYCLGHNTDMLKNKVVSLLN
jgi:hypothetical protein